MSNFSKPQEEKTLLPLKDTCLLDEEHEDQKAGHANQGHPG